MFTTNPWAVYVQLAGPVIAGYYLFAAFRFYGREIKAKINARKGFIRKRAEPLADPDEQIQEKALEETDYSETAGKPKPRVGKIFPPLGLWKNRVLFGQDESLAEHLTAVIEEAHEKGYDRQELVLLLQMTIRDYLDFEDTPFQSAITACIETECAKYGSIHLGEKDIAAIWNRV